MTKAVIDTNVLVSALLTPDGNPAKILSLALNGRISVCHDSRILLEYEDVLSRPKFPFAPEDVSGLIDVLVQVGTSVVATPLTDRFTDEADKKFYEVAKHCGAKLITGNLKHFPDDSDVLSPAEFMRIAMKNINR
ncbi:MAG: putative toxin-antitoxin system toxin component, PIN family [Oscillospiraceae bacterium]|nr:putative toxin-antitoxin system toxin component, PIN family [Oscillospiraceae bacterium]